MGLFPEDFKARLEQIPALKQMVLEKDGTTTRIYPGLPQGPQYPAISFHTMIAQVSENSTAASGILRRRVEIDCWHPKLLTASALDEVLRLGLLPRGVPGPIGNCVRDVVRDEYSEAAKCWVVVSEYYVFHQEPTS